MRKIRTTHFLFWTILAFSVIQARPAVYNQETAADSCALAEVSAFDFQLGIWEEINGTSVHSVKKILNGCVIQEVWEGGSLNDAIALKSYDTKTQRWYLSWVSSSMIHQFWEGRKEGKQWRFYREWILEGKPVLSRTYWNALTDDRIERVVEQSRDGGKTWKPHVRVLYQRKGAGN